jgi:hypothetical protein
MDSGGQEERYRFRAGALLLVRYEEVVIHFAPHKENVSRSCGTRDTIVVRRPWHRTTAVSCRRNGDGPKNARLFGREWREMKKRPQFTFAIVSLLSFVVFIVTTLADRHSAYQHNQDTRAVSNGKIISIARIFRFRTNRKMDEKIR